MAACNLKVYVDFQISSSPVKDNHFHSLKIQDVFSLRKLRLTWEFLLPMTSTHNFIQVYCFSSKSASISPVYQSGRRNIQKVCGSSQNHYQWDSWGNFQVCLLRTQESLKMLLKKSSFWIFSQLGLATSINWAKDIGCYQQFQTHKYWKLGYGDHRSQSWGWKKLVCHFWIKRRLWLIFSLSPSYTRLCTWRSNQYWSTLSLLRALGLNFHNLHSESQTFPNSLDLIVQSAKLNKVCQSISPDNWLLLLLAVWGRVEWARNHCCWRKTATIFQINQDSHCKSMLLFLFRCFP